MEISDEDFKKANRQGVLAKAAFPAATAVGYDRRTEKIVITLASGLQLAFSPRLVQGLETALPADLDVAEISPSGLGLHFPRLDADIYLPALVQGFLGSTRWMAQQMGSSGGKSATGAKASASRQNGKLGGRPRKIVPRSS